MTITLGPILAAILLAQNPERRPATGEVVDSHGKAVANARVVFYAPPVAYLKGDPVEANTTANGEGKFSLIIPRPLERALVNGIHFIAYAPGRAIAANLIYRPPHRLVLQNPQAKTVKVEGPDGGPVPGARVALRVFYGFGGTLAEVPDSLADSLATTTGPDGTTSIGYLAARDKLFAVRVTADQIGAQDFLLLERPLRGSEPPVITIRLKKTSFLSGRVVDQHGQPLGGQLVEIWSNQQGNWLLPNLVGFKQGPVRTSPDGSFQTPPNLQQGLSYRVAIRAPGTDPVFSDWITIQEKPHPLPLLVQRSLHTIRGRVVDRQGKAVAGARVFQSGDGPERTETTTAADGQFSLGGFRQGPVVVFVRAAGFRFHGQLIKPAAGNVTAELTRDSEPPKRQMTTLPDVISLDESRSLARALLEPCWKAVAASDDSTKCQFLEDLVPADPAGVIEKLETLKFASDGWRCALLREVVLALAERDQEEAESFAESIADPATRSWGLVHLADRIPDLQRQRKLALLDRALQHARIAPDQSDRLSQMGDVAVRWLELGQTDKARALFAEGKQIATAFTDKTDFQRGMFAAKLARVDLPAAEALARDFKGDSSEGRILANMAFGLAESSSADAERLWKQAAGMRRIGLTDPALWWKLGSVDPARALRVIQGWPHIDQRLHFYFYVALGARNRDEAIARQCFRTGLQGLDRMLEETPERYLNNARSLLPVVEHIDPALVPEVFWRQVASRLPYGNPRASHVNWAAPMIEELAVYDREVAAALLQPALARMETTDPKELAAWSFEFLAWAQIDPRAAVAHLEQTPIPEDPGTLREANIARFVVGHSLARTRADRWRTRRDERDIIFGGKRSF